MYTVILYLEDEQISIEKYKFVFYSFQADDQLYLCPWKRDSKLKEIVNVLNEVTQSHSEWKLVIFAGMCQVMKAGFGSKMPDILKDLIRKYSEECESDKRPGYSAKGRTGRLSGNFGKHKPGKQPDLESFPEQIYYIMCSTRRLFGGEKTDFFRIDQYQNLGKSLRMFWFEVNTDCEKSISYDLFRLNCAILALAVNDIPSGFVEYGYLHHLKIDIDKDLLAQYVLEREHTLKKIRQQLEIEGEKLRGLHKTGVEYPVHADFLVKLDDLRGMTQKEGRTERLKHSDLTDVTKLSGKLENNRAKVLRRLCYPKGMLNGQAASLQKQVEDARGAGDFLNEAGKEELERKKWETLEKICKEKRVWLKQLDFESEFEEKEENVRKCAEKKITRGVKIILGFLLAILETIMIAPFFWYSWKERNSGAGENLIYKLINWLSGFRPFHTWEGKESWPAWLLLFLTCLGIVGLCILIFGLASDIKRVRAYNRHIEQRLKDQQLEKGKYFKGILKELAEYQYCMRLSREQAEMEAKWNEERQRLRIHRSVCRQSNVICQQLKAFIDEEQIQDNIEISPVNIREDPQQIEYYWVPFKNSKGEAEINLSGTCVNVAFYFVTGVHIMKTLKIKEGK